MRIISGFLLLMFCFSCAPKVDIQIVKDYNRQKYLRACVIGPYTEINNMLEEELKRRNFVLIDDKKLISVFIRLGYHDLDKIILTEDIRKIINEELEVDALFIYEIGDLKKDFQKMF